MDKYNNVVIKEKTSKANIVIIIISIIVLIAGGFGIWWFIEQENTNKIETSTENIEQVESENESSKAGDIIAYNGVKGKTATELLGELYESRVEIKTDSDGVKIVSAIDGVASNEEQKWELFVNGKLYKKDPSLYVTKNTDLLEWKLNEKISSSSSRVEN